MTAFDKNTEANSPEHNIVEIESIGESLGSKYYEFDGKGRNLVDADDSNNNENKAKAVKQVKNSATVKKDEIKPQANKAEEKSKNETKTNKKTKIVVNDPKENDDKRKNLRVDSEVNKLNENNNNKPDTNDLKVQKVKVLPVRRMSGAEA